MNASSFCGVDVLTDVVHDTVYYLLDQMRGHDWLIIANATLAVSQALIDGAERDRQALVRRSAPQVADSAGKSGFAHVGDRRVSVVTAPTMTQWLESVSILVHTALPASLDTLQRLHHQRDHHRAWPAAQKRCSVALLNLVYFTLLSYRRVADKVAHAEKQHDSANSPAAGTPTSTTHSARRNSCATANKRDATSTTDSSTENTPCAHGDCRCQYRMPSAQQRALLSLQHARGQLHRCFARYYLFISMNADHQLRTHLRPLLQRMPGGTAVLSTAGGGGEYAAGRHGGGVVVELDRAPLTRDLPHTPLYLSALDGWVWLLVGLALYDVSPAFSIRDKTPSRADAAVEHEEEQEMEEEVVWGTHRSKSAARCRTSDDSGNDAHTGAKSADKRDRLCRGCNGAYCDVGLGRGGVNPRAATADEEESLASCGVITTVLRRLQGHVGLDGPDYARRHLITLLSALRLHLWLWARQSELLRWLWRCWAAREWCVRCSAPPSLSAALFAHVEAVNNNNNNSASHSVAVRNNSTKSMNSTVAHGTSSNTGEEQLEQEESDTTAGLRDVMAVVTMVTRLVRYEPQLILGEGHACVRGFVAVMHMLQLLLPMQFVHLSLLTSPLVTEEGSTDAEWGTTEDSNIPAAAVKSNGGRSTPLSECVGAHREARLGARAGTRCNGQSAGQPAQRHTYGGPLDEPRSLIRAVDSLVVALTKGMASVTPKDCDSVSCTGAGRCRSRGGGGGGGGVCCWLPRESALVLFELTVWCCACAQARRGAALNLTQLSTLPSCSSAMWTVWMQWGMAVVQSGYGENEWGESVPSDEEQARADDERRTMRRCAQAGSFIRHDCSTCVQTRSIDSVSYKATFLHQLADPLKGVCGGGGGGRRSECAGRAAAGQTTLMRSGAVCADTRRFFMASCLVAMALDGLFSWVVVWVSCVEEAVTRTRGCWRRSRRTAMTRWAHTCGGRMWCALWHTCRVWRGALSQVGQFNHPTTTATTTRSAAPCSPRLYHTVCGSSSHVSPPGAPCADCVAKGRSPGAQEKHTQEVLFAEERTPTAPPRRTLPSHSDWLPFIDDLLQHYAEVAAGRRWRQDAPHAAPSCQTKSCPAASRAELSDAARDSGLLLLPGTVGETKGCGCVHRHYWLLAVTYVRLLQWVSRSASVMEGKESGAGDGAIEFVVAAPGGQSWAFWHDRGYACYEDWSHRTAVHAQRCCISAQLGGRCYHDPYYAHRYDALEHTPEDTMNRRNYADGIGEDRCGRNHNPSQMVDTVLHAHSRSSRASRPPHRISSTHHPTSRSNSAVGAICETAAVTPPGLAVSSTSPPASMLSLSAQCRARQHKPPVASAGAVTFVSATAVTGAETTAAASAGATVRTAGGVGGSVGRGGEGVLEQGVRRQLLRAASRLLMAALRTARQSTDGVDSSTAHAQAIAYAENFTQLVLMLNNFSCPELRDLTRAMFAHLDASKEKHASSRRKDVEETGAKGLTSVDMFSARAFEILVHDMYIP